MTTQRRRGARMLAALAAAVPIVAALAPSAQAADAFPERPLALVVPYAPGGSADTLARALAQHMGDTLGQTVVVDNKPGANTMIAASHVARTDNDGYTMLMASNASLVLNPMLYAKIQYDAKRDLQPLAVVAEIPLVAVVNPQVPASTLAELIDYDRANPGKLNYASVGTGNPIHLAAEMLKSRSGMTAVHVPFNGSAPALAALVGNDVQLMMDVVSSSLPLIQAGRLKPLAVASAQRLAALPDVPTIAQSGYPGYQAATWFGLAVPSGTPPGAMAALRNAADEAMRDPQFQETFNRVGLVVQEPRSAEEVTAYVEADRERWAALIKDNGIRLD